MTQVFHATLAPYKVTLYTDNSFRFIPAGHRLSVIRWKETTDKVTGVKKPAKSALCVPVPLISFEIEPACLADSAREHFEAQQDLIVRQVIDKWFAENANTMLTDILIDPWSVTPEGLAKFTLNTQIGAKLSQELIGDWFTSSVEPVLSEKLSALPASTPDMVERAVRQHKEIMQKLASPKAVLNEQTTKQLLKVIGFCEEDDSFVKSAIVKKLNSFLASDAELLMSL